MEELLLLNKCNYVTNLKVLSTYQLLYPSYKLKFVNKHKIVGFKVKVINSDNFISSC